MVASCSRQFGPQVVLTDKMNGAGLVFEQKRTCGEKQPVFGTQVDESRMEVRERKEGGAFIRFRLPTSAPPLTTPALFPRGTGELTTPCSTSTYMGTSVNFEPAVRLAYKNCIRD